MSAVIDRLTEIEARVAAATEGPWTTGPGSWIEGAYLRDARGYSLLDGSDASCEVGTERDADAAFIAAARTDVPALAAALRAVLAEHRRGPRRVGGVLVNPPWCQESETDEYPCTTLVAIAAALGVTP